MVPEAAEVAADNIAEIPSDDIISPGVLNPNNVQ